MVSDSLSVVSVLLRQYADTSCVVKLLKGDESFPFRDDNYRHAVLREFPDVIVFRVTRKTIVVYAVFHTGRNPGNRI